MTRRRISLERKFKYLVSDDTAKLVIMPWLEATLSIGF